MKQAKKAKALKASPVTVDEHSCLPPDSPPRIGEIEFLVQELHGYTNGSVTAENALAKRLGTVLRHEETAAGGQELVETETDLGGELAIILAKIKQLEFELVDLFNGLGL